MNEAQNTTRGNSIGMDRAYSEAKTPSRIPPLENSLNDLESAVASLSADAGELAARLGPVSQPIPASIGTASPARAGSSCYYQNRIDELRERVSSVATGLREAREMLCI